MNEEKSKNNVRKWIKKKRTSIIVCITIILMIQIPAFVNFLINTEAVIFPSFFGFVTSENRETWIGFLGAFIGGAETLIGVAWTLVDQNRKRKKDVMDFTRPILIVNDCKAEEIHSHNGVCALRYKLEYKNVGNGILFNPRILNIDHRIDNKGIGKLNISSHFIKNFLNINETSGDDLTLTFNPEDISKMKNLLKGRGNSLCIQIVMYVGGKDMYDRDVATKLIYKSIISLYSESRIELPLGEGKFTSTVIFDENEINKIVSNADSKYNVNLY